MSLSNFDTNSVFEVIVVISGIISIIISLLILTYAIYKLLRGSSGYKYSEINPLQKSERRSNFSFLIIWFIGFLAYGSNIIYFFVFSKWG